MRSTTDRSGFTLMELVVAMGVSLALGIGGFAFFRSQVRSLTDQSAELDAIEGARAALDFMAYEFREAGANPNGDSTCAAAAALSNASSTDVTIKYCNTSNTVQTIRYRYSSDSKAITRNDGNSTATLIAHVPSGGLSVAYSTDGTTFSTTPPGSLTTVVAVQITVQVQAARATTVTTTTLTSAVALRNRVLARLGVQG